MTTNGDSAVNRDGRRCDSEEIEHPDDRLVKVRAWIDPCPHHPNPTGDDPVLFTQIASDGVDLIGVVMVALPDSRLQLINERGGLADRDVKGPETIEVGVPLRVPIQLSVTADQVNEGDLLPVDLVFCWISKDQVNFSPGREMPWLLTESDQDELDLLRSLGEVGEMVDRAGWHPLEVRIALEIGNNS